MSVFSNVQLVDGKDDTADTVSFSSLNAAAAQDLEESDRHALHVGNSITSAAVLAPGKRPFTVGKPDKMIDIDHSILPP